MDGPFVPASAQISRAAPFRLALREKNWRKSGSHKPQPSVFLFPVFTDHFPPPAHNCNEGRSTTRQETHELFERKIEENMQSFFVASYRNAVLKRRKTQKNSRKSFVA
jgi:hypothetical protein